jgi:hypothetical protein
LFLFSFLISLEHTQHLANVRASRNTRNPGCELVIRELPHFGHDLLTCDYIVRLELPHELINAVSDIRFTK